MITRYETRFALYHYNSGDGRNGTYKHAERFEKKEDAFALLDKLKGWLVTKESTSEFASQYCWDGYLTAVDGVYEITEKKIVPSTL